MDLKKATRFKDADWFDQEDSPHVIIGGAGGIGSWLTLLLARAGFSPIVYDFDIVEEHNIGGQLFGEAHIYETKVSAVKSIVKTFTGHEITANNQEVTSKTMSHCYVFSAFDNMLARKEMFESWVKLAEAWVKAPTEGPEPIFIDG